MHAKELHDFYILAEHMARRGEMRNMEGRPRIGWEDDIKMVLKAIGVMLAGDISLRIKSRRGLNETKNLEAP
jgi:hypothetical protein